MVDAQVRPVVNIFDSYVVKTYPRSMADRYVRELAAHTALPEFSVRLLDFDDDELTLVTERHIPLLYLDRADSVQYRQPLWELLQGVHNAGWWHRDTCLVNVVVDHGRPLLIDWENVSPARGDVSYDLYGAQRAGVRSAWNHPHSVYWFNDCPRCPERYWRTL